MNDDTQPQNNHEPIDPSLSTETNEGTDWQAKSDEYLAGWKRAQADYLNLQKTIERERADLTKFANERLLRDLLPMIDQFSLALRFMPSTDELPEEQKKIWQNWLVGVKAVKSLWDQAASGIGLEPVPVDTGFNPALHDAVGQEVVEGKEPGSIARVVQNGWMWHGRVLQPAKVIVVEEANTPA